MEDKIRQGDLFDYYGPLLNDHQRKVFEEAVLMDLSLQEVAENQGTSRQAVHDLIHRCTVQMEEYEDALHLIRDRRRVRKDLEKLRECLEALPVGDHKKALALLQKIGEEI